MECEALDRYDIVITDLDGVILLGGEPIRPNLEVLSELSRRDGSLYVVTNNSTRSRRMYSALLEGLGLSIPPERVVTSGFSAARLVTMKLGRSKVFAVGEEGLLEELVGEGHMPLTLSEAREAEAVVVGLDRNLSYAKLSAALNALREGALFVATNLDNALPGPDGMRPGAGAVVAALETASGRRHDYNAGKPSEWMVRTLVEVVGAAKASRMVVIGDRVDTDIAMASRAGLDSILVLTGATRRDYVRSRELPANTMVAEDLKSLCRGEYWVGGGV